MNNEAANIIEKILQTAKDVMPESLGNDIKDNLRAALSDVLQELDVVTREELETQQAVLAKTRAKVEHLEQIVSEMEQQITAK